MTECMLIGYGCRWIIYNSIRILACQVKLFPESAVQAGYREYVRWQNACLSVDDVAHSIYVESPFAHPSVMFRRQAVQDVGAYQQGNFPEDYVCGYVCRALIHDVHVMLLTGCAQGIWQNICKVFLDSKIVLWLAGARVERHVVGQIC